MRRRAGATIRILRKDVGGMPLWVLAVAVALILTAAITAVRGGFSHHALPSYSPTERAAPALPEPMPLAVFLGDSYTRGVGGDGVTWPGLVGEEHGWDVENLSLGGTGYLRTADQSGCGRDYCGSYAEAAGEIIGSPRLIFVAGGRNDIGTPPKEIEDAATSLLTGLQRSYPDAQVIVLAPWWGNDPIGTSERALSAAVETAATRAGAEYLDTGQPLEGKPKLMSKDGIHPNADGYRALAAAIEAELPASLP